MLFIAYGNVKSLIRRNLIKQHSLKKWNQFIVLLNSDLLVVGLKNTGFRDPWLIYCGTLID